mgnify:CR=1 FL=1
MNEKNVSTALDNTADDEEARDDNGCDDAEEEDDNEHTQGEVNHEDRQVPKASVLDDLLGVSTTSMDVDPSSVNGETELNAYMRVQQVVKDTDPLMWWKQHVQEFPRLTRMVRQHLAVPATSASPERLFSSVGLVKSDLRGRLLDSTLIDVMWDKQVP